MKTFEPLIIGIAEGFRNHPLPNLPFFKLVPFADKEELAKADIFVQNNILEQKRKKMIPYYKYILDSGKPYLCTEASIFRKNMVAPGNPKAYHRWSWFSYFRDEGDYNNDNCPNDRWLRIQKEQRIEIKDWKTSGDNILVILQRPGDSSLKNLLKKYTTYENFLTSVVNEIRSNTDRTIRFRMHPFRQTEQLTIINKLNLPNIEISTNMQGSGGAGGGQGGEGLLQDFKDAKVVVGFNSNALTESVCEGVPTFSICPSSMAWECSNKNLSSIEHPITFDRTQWLSNLGYCQWTEEEIAKGDPWYHLKPLYERYK